MSRNGYNVTVLCGERDIDQRTTFRNISVRITNYYLAGLKYKLFSIIPLEIMYSIYSFLSLLVDKKYDFIVGVDREGIIEASILSKLYKCGYGLWSFEIMFEDETSLFFKKPERIACKNIDFAIVQDSIRSKLLSNENNIPLDKFYEIPVAGRKAVLLEKKSFLHNSFNIPKEKKILLFIGSVSEWAVEEVVENITYLPEEWVLVVHDRYGHYPKWFMEKVTPYLNRKIFISCFQMLSFEDLKVLVSSADMGIGFYKATFQDRWTGRNLKYLGFSSGKISTYLQYGLPVLVNDIGELAFWLTKHNIGIIVKNIQDIGSEMQKLDFKNIRERCASAFDSRLSFSNYEIMILDLIEKAVYKRRGNEQ